MYPTSGYNPALCLLNYSFWTRSWCVLWPAEHYNNGRHFLAHREIKTCQLLFINFVLPHRLGCLNEYFIVKYIHILLTLFSDKLVKVRL
jgi:hypothetical protein